VITRGSTLSVDRFLRAYSRRDRHDVIDIMYADPKAIEAFAKYAHT